MRKLKVFIIQKKYLITVPLLLAAVLATYILYECHLAKASFGEIFGPLCIVNKKIFLDPGHGGEDPGCNDPRRGIYEEDINLNVAKKANDILIRTGAEIIMSRKSDKDFVQPKTLRGNLTKKKSDLLARIKMAGDSKADVFVSLHVNATRKKTYSGAETFYNPSDPYSELLAQYIQKYLRTIPDMTKRTAKPGSYYILNNTSMPSVIVEMGYLTNRKEEDLLIKDDYQQALALAISRGLVDYFKDCTLGNESTVLAQVAAVTKPKLAIIIDDLGTSYNKGVRNIFALHGYPLTIAIMPNLDKTKEHAEEAHT
jgi:N-acetylmuramoyl-L-alanine amidase